MSFYTSMSGLQASQTEMSTISHNLANVSTNGFKKSRTDFADVIASSVNVSPTQMVGSGTVVKGNVQQFTEGNLVQSGSSLDLAISGDGFFAVKPDVGGTATNFTRDGAFSVDANHYVVDAQGAHLQVYPVDGSGTVVATGLDSTIPLQLPATSGTPAATTTVTTAVNLSATEMPPATTPFNRFDAKSYNNSQQTTVYDAAGNPQTMTSYYVRSGTGTPSAWNVYSFVGDQQLTTGGGASDHLSLGFDAAGTMTSPTTATQFDPFTPTGTSVPQNMSLTFGSATTQSTSPFSVVNTTQDGAAVGQLQGVTVDATGVVKASFSNGDTQALGMVALANFNNPSGLRQLGSGDWASTGVSGSPVMGSAGENGLGTLMSGMIERSNVDITEELVDLIAAQRNFQANAKALDTQSQTAQSIIQIQS